MKPKIITWLFAVSVFPHLAAQEKEEPQFKAYWRNGFRVESTDSKFKLSFGGMLQYDYAFFMQDADVEAAFEEINHATELRRVRVYHGGTLDHFINYKLQVDFAGGKVAFKDVYISFSKIPGVGNFTAGQFKVPFRLDALTGSKYVTFMERALPAALMNDRSLGFMISNEAFKSRLAWQAGVFRNSEALGQDIEDDSRINASGRLTGLVLKNDEKNRLLHLGVAYNFRSLKGKGYKVSAQPESHLAPEYAEIDLKGIRNVHFTGGEVAYVEGPFSLQGEIVSAMVNVDSTGEQFSFMSYYGQASWFITGESRNYKNSYLGFDRVTPKKNLGKGGCGAWEFALRYSAIDLNDGLVHGGQFYDITAGLNWYMNPVTRILFNYIFSRVKNVGNTGIIQTRFQIDF